MRSVLHGPSRAKLGCLSCLSLLAGLATQGSEARADQVRRGAVISLEASEAYFAVDNQTGIAAGQKARLKHPIRLKHPVTGTWVEDELPIGEATVTMVGESMGMLRLGPELFAQVGLGDVVEVLVPGATPKTAQRPKAALPSVPELDAETREVLAAWQAAAGRRLDLQIATWEDFLERHPDSKFKEAIALDLKLLYEAQKREPSHLVDDEVSIEGFDHLGPSKSEEDFDVPLAFAVRDPDAVQAAWLHYRRRGDDTYHRVKLQRDGDVYLRGSIPALEAAAPGVEYFVEVATVDGRSGPAVGQPSRPQMVQIEDPTPQALRDTQNRSRVSMTASYLDYATFDRRRRDGEYEDRYFLFETDFLFRLRARSLHGIRVGMGVLNGEGGYKDVREPEEAGFQYGYTEFEFRSRPTRAYLLRGIAGLGRDGLGFGVEGRLRLGAEESSNLTFALSSLEDVGFLTEVRMQWAAIEDLPLGFGVAVTDQPNNGDLGVRLSTDLGWRALDWFQPTVRVSYQGRSIQHSGLGVGLGMVFDW